MLLGARNLIWVKYKMENTTYPTLFKEFRLCVHSHLVAKVEIFWTILSYLVNGNTYWLTDQLLFLMTELHASYNLSWGFGSRGVHAHIYCIQSSMSWTPQVQRTQCIMTLYHNENKLKAIKMIIEINIYKSE